MDEIISVAYAPNVDKSFIMKEVYNDGEPVSAEVVGWYWGEPDDDATEMYVGRLKAEYK